MIFNSDPFDGSPILATQISDGTPTTTTYEELGVVVDTVTWLQEAGYISYENNSGFHYFDKVCLTAKGLELLKAVPSSLDHSQSIGSHLHEAVKSGSKKAASDIVNQALTKGYLLLQSSIS